MLLVIKREAAKKERVGAVAVRNLEKVEAKKEASNKNVGAAKKRAPVLFILSSRRVAQIRWLLQRRRRWTMLGQNDWRWWQKKQQSEW